MFYIHYSPDALENLERLDPSQMKIIRRKVEEKLKVYADILGKPLRYALHGQYSLRVGDWRVVYQIQKDVVVVTSVFHRRKGYG